MVLVAVFVQHAGGNGLVLPRHLPPPRQGHNLLHRSSPGQHAQKADPRRQKHRPIAKQGAQAQLNKIFA